MVQNSIVGQADFTQMNEREVQIGRYRGEQIMKESQQNAADPGAQDAQRLVGIIQLIADPELQRIAEAQPVIARQQQPNQEIWRQKAGAHQKYLFPVAA